MLEPHAYSTEESGWTTTGQEHPAMRPIQALIWWSLLDKSLMHQCVIAATFVNDAIASKK